MNIQNRRSTLKISILIAVFPEKSNLDDIQNNDFKVSIINMIIKLNVIGKTTRRKTRKAQR